jgi:hypothetical protein
VRYPGFCNRAGDVKSLVLVTVAGLLLLSVVGALAAT